MVGPEVCPYCEHEGEEEQGTWTCSCCQRKWFMEGRWYICVYCKQNIDYASVAPTFCLCVTAGHVVKRPERRYLNMAKGTEVRPGAVKELRTMMDMDQATFAESVGVNKSTVSRWEKGMKFSKARYAELKALADIYGVDLHNAPVHNGGTREEEAHV